MLRFYGDVLTGGNRLNAIFITFGFRFHASSDAIGNFYSFN